MKYIKRALEEGIEKSAKTFRYLELVLMIFVMLIMNDCGKSEKKQAPVNSMAEGQSVTEAQKDKERSQETGASEEQNEKERPQETNAAEEQNKNEELQETNGAERQEETKSESEAESVDSVFKEVTEASPKGVITTKREEAIVQTGEVNGRSYSVTFDLSKWEQYTSGREIAMLSELFWECYPKMFERFCDLSDAPTDVTIAIENEGYAVAEAGGNFVHLHDQWLYSNPMESICRRNGTKHGKKSFWVRIF